MSIRTAVTDRSTTMIARKRHPPLPARPRVAIQRDSVGRSGNPLRAGPAPSRWAAAELPLESRGRVGAGYFHAGTEYYGVLGSRYAAIRWVGDA